MVSQGREMNEQINALNSSNKNFQVFKKTADIICGKWRLYIIYQMVDGAVRYGELRRMIPEISEKVLIHELKSLITLDVVEKKVYSEVPPRVEYGLTIRGKRILPTLLALTYVGETFMEP